MKREKVVIYLARFSKFWALLLIFSQSYSSHSEPEYFYPPVQINTGMVNLNCNHIGGRANPLAGEITYHPDEDRYILTSGTGEKRIYERNILNPEKGAYHLVRAEDQNGNYLTYTYQTNPAFPGYCQISRITNSSGNWASFNYDRSKNIASIAASDGRSVYYSYDSAGNLIEVTQPDNTKIKYQYQNNNIARIIKPNGEVLENIYDDEWRVVEQRSTVGTDDQLTTTAQLSYDPESDSTVITDGKGYRTTFQYDEEKRLTAVADDDANERTYQWDDSSNLLLISDRKDHIHSYAYDGNGNILSSTDSFGDTIIYEYNDCNLITRIIPPDGCENLFEYDENGNLISEKKVLSDGTLYRDTVYQLNEHGEPISITVAANTEDASTMQLEYEINGKVIKITDPEGEETHLSYDNRGNLVFLSNAENSSLTFEYDSLNRLATVNAPLDRTISFNHDQNGNLTSLTDSLGRVTNYSYDKCNNLLKVLDPSGGATGFTRNVKGEVVTLTDPKNNSTHYAYNLHSKIATITDALGYTTEYTYDPVGNLSTVRDKRNHVSSYTYDAANQLKTIIDAAGNSYELDCDTRGNVTRAVDKNGNITHYSYDELGRLEAVDYKDASDTVTVSSMSFTYDHRDNLASRTDGRNFTTCYVYDKADRLIKVVDPLGAETEYRYDLAGRLMDIIDANGHTQLHLEYDEAGRTVGIVDGENNHIAYEYDAGDNVTKITDPRGNATEYAYDALSRLIRIAYSDGGATQINRDFNGNIIKIIDPQGNRYNYTYDRLNRVTKVTDTGWKNTYFEYDANGNRTKIIDYIGNETNFSYDSLNRLTHIEDAMGNITSYSYDANGNIIRRIDANSLITEYEHDPLNRLTGIIYPSDPSKNENLCYDASGNLTAASGPTGALNFGYDANNKLISSSSPLGAVDYSYDLMKNRQRTTYPQGLKTLTYEYDNATRLKKIQSDSGDITYSYDENGNLIQQSYPNGASLSCLYDGLNRLRELENIISESASISRYQFNYDGLGNIVAETKKIGIGLPTEKQYDYDNSSRLVQENTSGVDTTYFTYDGLHNLLTKRQSGMSLTYQYNEVNQLIKLGSHFSEVNETITVQGDIEGTTSVMVNNVPAIISDNQFQADIEITGGLNSISATAINNEGKQSTKQIQVTLVRDKEDWTYDNNGNILSRTDEAGNVTSYAYDFENRLTEVRENGEFLAAYSYDVLGRRDSKTVNGETVKYIYDGLSFNSIMELDGGNIVKAIIIRGPDMGGGIGGIISVNRDGQEYYFHYNHRGDATVLTNQAAQTIQTYVYDAFGNLTSSNGSVENPYRFSTKQYDEETGFYYFGARYYNPEIGRFITQDPLRYVDGLNQYTYAHNNPLKFIDPFGLSAQNPIHGAFPGKYGNSGLFYNTNVWVELWRLWSDQVTSNPITQAAGGHTVGMVEAVVYLPHGMWQTIRHPITTIKNIPAGLIIYGQQLSSNDPYTSAKAWGNLTAQIELAIVGYKSSQYFHGKIKHYLQKPNAAKSGLVIGDKANSITAHGTHRTNDHGFSIRNVNPTGGTYNCSNCSVAGDATLAGRPAVALPGDITPLEVLETHFKSKFVPMESQSAITTELIKTGHGSRGIVFGSSSWDEPGHVFNAVNQKGVVRFLDAQVGKPASFEGFSWLEFLRIN